MLVRPQDVSRALAEMNPMNRRTGIDDFGVELQSDGSCVNYALNAKYCTL